MIKNITNDDHQYGQRDLNPSNGESEKVIADTRKSDLILENMNRQESSSYVYNI